MGKKLGLDKAYSNLLTTVNKNSPSGIGKGITPSFKSIGKKLMDNPVLGSRLLSTSLESKSKTSNILKTATKNVFKRSPIGRIIDAGVKIGAGVGAGYSYAKEKFKPDNKMGGGMMYGYETGGMSSKQKAIAAKAPPPNVLDGKDFAVLRAEKAKNRGMGLQDESMKPGKIMKAKYGKEAKIKKVMKEFKKGELHIGKSKKKVKNKKQAIAIALSEARKGKA